MQKPNVLVLVLAGGEGRRLLPLTRERCKPAVAFGGSLRLIDFTLFNCFASKLFTIHLLTQYRPGSLEEYVAMRWGPILWKAGGSIPCLTALDHYSGTADAAYQSLWLIERARPDAVLILSADQVYRANYEELVERHLASGADITVLTGELPPAQALRFGVVSCAEGGRITDFIEKPATIGGWAAGGPCRINLGVYCFRPDCLSELLRANALAASHDFGHDILPEAVRSMSVEACPLARVAVGGSAYWRDLGTVESYFDASMDLLGDPARFELADPRWDEDSPFWSWLPARSPAAMGHSGAGLHGRNLIGTAARLESRDITDCIISPWARVGRGARLERCILLPRARVGAGARLSRVIVDEGSSVEPRSVIGLPYGDAAAGVTVVSQAAAEGAAPLTSPRATPA